MVNDCIQLILECVGKPSTIPTEFVGLLEEDKGHIALLQQSEA